MTRQWRRQRWLSAAWHPLQLHHAPHCHPHSTNTHRRRLCRLAPRLPPMQPPWSPLPTRPWCPRITAYHVVTRRRCRCPVRRCLRFRRRSCVPATWRTHRRCPGETPPRKWVSNTPLLKWHTPITIESKRLGQFNLQKLYCYKYSNKLTVHQRFFSYQNRCIPQGHAGIPNLTCHPNEGIARTAYQWGTSCPDFSGNRRPSTRLACHRAYSVAGGVRNQRCPRIRTSRTGRLDVTRCHLTLHTTLGAETPESAWVQTCHAFFFRFLYITLKITSDVNDMRPFHSTLHLLIHIF